MADLKKSPATKQDLHELETRITTRFDEKITQAITKSEASILRHFDLTVETIRHDLLGANADEIGDLKNKVIRIEKHVGLASA